MIRYAALKPRPLTVQENKKKKKKLEGKLPLLAVDPIDLMILQPFQVY